MLSINFRPYYASHEWKRPSRRVVNYQHYQQVIDQVTVTMQWTTPQCHVAYDGGGLQMSEMPLPALLYQDKSDESSDTDPEMPPLEECHGPSELPPLGQLQSVS